MENPIDVAFIGAGYMTTEHLKAFRDIPNANLKGIYSRTLDRANDLASQWGLEHVCTSIEELYLKTKASLVVVSVPELSTNDVLKECFDYSWTILIEKPVGYNLADAESIAQNAKKSGCKAYVALNRRHYTSTRSVLEGLTKSSEPRFIHIQDQEDAKAALKAGQPELVVKNWMYANSIHLIDYFSFLGRGKVTEVKPVVSWTAENPLNVIATVHYDSGDLGLYQAVWNAPGPWSVAVTTPSKRWEMRPVEQGGFQEYGSRIVTPIEIDKQDTQFKPGLRYQAELVVKAAKGEVVNELPSIEDALESMKLVNRIYQV